MLFRSLPLDELIIDDETAFRHVAIYEDLKGRLRRDAVQFAVLDDSQTMATPDGARLLNLAFWDPDHHSEVLCDRVLTADQVMHNAWHHVAQQALGPAAKTATGMLLAESVASAFDLYLVGRLLGHAPNALFLETQVPAMSDACASAGMEEGAFTQLLQGASEEPEQSFESLRQLLFDASCTFIASTGLDDAVTALQQYSRHPFAPLLHHYELSTWVLYTKAYADDLESAEAVTSADQALRQANDPIAWLDTNWLQEETR